MPYPNQEDHMAIDATIKAALDSIVSEPWKVTEPRDVPESETVALLNGAASIDATYLYADLANSSGLAQKVSPQSAARVVRMYLNMAVRVLRHYEGHVRSFDGDRVMAVFVGDSKNSHAFRAALAINFYVTHTIPNLLVELPEVAAAGWKMQHGIGIDTGPALLVRGGVRSNNDLVSIGAAPNVAAKLADIRDLDPIHITNRAIGRVRQDFREHSDGRIRYRLCGEKEIGGERLVVHSSNWYWGLG
jgi:adenylate cyclase